jgi:hypothetical protein
VICVYRGLKNPILKHVTSKFPIGSIIFDDIPSTYLYKYKFYAYGVIIKIIFFLYFIFIYLLAPIIYHALPPKQEPQTQTTIVWQLPRFF